MLGGAGFLPSTVPFLLVYTYTYTHTILFEGYIHRQEMPKAGRQKSYELPTFFG